MLNFVLLQIAHADTVYMCSIIIIKIVLNIFVRSIGRTKNKNFLLQKIHHRVFKLVYDFCIMVKILHLKNRAQSEHYCELLLTLHRKFLQPAANGLQCIMFLVLRETG